jgi:hypothetical protein
MDHDDEFSGSSLVSEVRELLRRGAVDDANARVSDCLARDSGRADGWYLRGVIANRRREHAVAIASLQRAIELDSMPALTWLALGTALTRSDALPQAADAYREAIVRRPAWADAHLNLGLVLRRQGNLESAMRALYAAWTRNPMLFDAPRHCVATIADVVRRAGSATIPLEHVGIGARPSFSVVFCSIDAKKADRTRALYRRLFAGYQCEIKAVERPRSLANAYNEAVRDSVGQFIVMSHDDIDVLAEDFVPRLVRLFDSFDVIGVVGSNRADGPAIGWSGHPHLRGWITHCDTGDAAWRVDVLNPRPIAEGVMMLDGVLLAARREVLVTVPFDADTFDGFHLYDLDWSYRAVRAGFRLGTAGDLLLVHASRGNYGAAWQRYAARFCAKHAIGHKNPAPSMFYGATLDTANQARAFFAQLAALGSERG